MQQMNELAKTPDERTFAGDNDRGAHEGAAQEPDEGEGQGPGGYPVPHPASQGGADQEQLSTREGKHS